LALRLLRARSVRGWSTWSLGFRHKLQLLIIQRFYSVVKD
jgi:hypothetical protein